MINLVKFMLYEVQFKRKVYHNKILYQDSILKLLIKDENHHILELN